MVAGVLLIASFAVMVAGALVFTNAVEWLGTRLDLGHAAVGSVLAGVATAMPESLIPVLAIIGGSQGDEIAIGAVIGAPFLLATLAMAVSGAVALSYASRRGSTRLQPDRQATSRDLLLVVCAVSLAITVGLLGSPVLRIAGAVVLLITYALVTWKTIVRARQEGAGAEPARLYFNTAKRDPPSMFQVLAQTVVSLGLLVGATLSLITLRRSGGFPGPFIGCWAVLYVGGLASIIAIARP